MKVKSESEISQPCPTLSDPMDCSPPGSSIHGIFQARVLEWVAIAEYQRIDAFELWCWRRLLRVPWTTRRSSQSLLKEVRSGFSLEGPMLKLKFQYFDHLMQRADSLEDTLEEEMATHSRWAAVRGAAKSRKWLSNLLLFSHSVVSNSL